MTGAAGDALTERLAHEHAAALRAGEVSAREIAEAHLARAHRTDAGLHAWLTLDDERALAEADAADARIAAARAEGPGALEALHPLLGVPIALKDLVSVRGGQCTAGSRILEGYAAPFDAHITERLRDAGAVILGKTNMDEFAMGSSTEHSAFGPTANPWDLARVPGGSSGGSAAAVAARHAPLGIGTDTGGSIRQPAALTGIVGLKPTYGAISRYGMIAFASSLDQAGPFTRDVTDSAMLLSAMVGADPCDQTSLGLPEPVRIPTAQDLKGIRLGVPEELSGEGIDEGVLKAFNDTLELAKSLGATVETTHLPHAPHGLAAYYLIAPAECSSNLARYDGVRFGFRKQAETLLDMYNQTREAGFG